MTARALGLRPTTALRAALRATLGSALGLRAATVTAAGAAESAGECVASDGQEIGNGQESQLAAEEVFLAGFHIELADEALDENEVNRATHGEDTVGPWIGDDLDGRVLAAGGRAGLAGDAAGRWGDVVVRTLDAGGLLGGLLGGEQLGEGGGDFRDIRILDFDEAAALDGAGLVDFLLEIDELADERGVFRNDDGGGVRHSGNGPVSTELADNLGEGIHRLGRLDVAEGHDVGNDGITLRQGIGVIIDKAIFVINIHAAAGGA